MWATKIIGAAAAVAIGIALAGCSSDGMPAAAPESAPEVECLDVPLFMNDLLRGSTGYAGEGSAVAVEGYGYLVAVPFQQRGAAQIQWGLWNTSHLLDLDWDTSTNWMAYPLTDEAAIYGALPRNRKAGFDYIAGDEEAMITGTEAISACVDGYTWSLKEDRE